MNSLEIPQLTTTTLGRNAFHLPTTTSTQDTLKSLLPGAPEGTLILADRQEKGRGRQGHVWSSIPGPQLYFSLLLRPKSPPASWPIYNIVAGLALADAIEELGNVTARIKWPNDLFLKERKLAGILSEMVAPSLVLGIGVNVSGRIKEFPSEIREIATSLEEELGSVERLQLLGGFLNQLEEWISILDSGEKETIVQAFSQRWIYKNRPIKIITGAETIEGVSQTIDGDGALLLDTADGKTHRIVAGDVSLRLTP